MPKLIKPSTDVKTVLRNGMCNVYYEKSVTKNMGDYNSAKVTVGVTLPIDPTKEEIALIKSTIEKGDEVVTKELEFQISQLTEPK